MSELYDNCSLIGARRMAERILSYWRGRGYDTIKTWVEHSGLPVVMRPEGCTDGTDWALRAPHYVVKSNLLADGYPP